MSLTIGEVARRVGMTAEGLRYYERRGLVSPARRTDSGYRLYREEEIRRLDLIRSAQELGFSLDEIADLLELWDGGADSCEAMRSKLLEKLASVRRKIDALTDLEAQLVDGVARCDRRLDSGESEDCPILEELAAPGSS